MEQKDFPGLINRLQETLCLQHWRIKHRFLDDSKIGKSLMTISPNRERHMATITIRRSLIGKPANEIAPLLFHELLHLVIDPLVEEHAMQMEFEVSEDRLKEYQTRFTRPVEKVVEHLAVHVAPLISLEDHEDELHEQGVQINALAGSIQELLGVNRKLQKQIACTNKLLMMARQKEWIDDDQLIELSALST